MYFLGGSKHGQLWDPESELARNRFVALNGPDGECQYVRKSFESTDGSLVEFWVSNEIETVIGDFASWLNIRSGT